MDTSPKYVEMCAAAYPDLAPARGFEKIYDVYIHGRIACMPYQGYKAKRPQSIPAGSVWLPRQDDLQKMLQKEYVEPTAMIEDLLGWIRQQDDYMENVFAGNETMEMLWLCFVMYQNYEKVWTGERWEAA